MFSGESFRSMYPTERILNIIPTKHFVSIAKGLADNNCRAIKYARNYQRIKSTILTHGLLCK